MAPAHQHGPKETAIWQPLPSLKVLENKGFVRVQDGTGQTSHFTRSTYKSLSALAPIAAAQDNLHPGHDRSDENSGSAPVHAGLHDDEIEAIRQLAYERGLAEGRELQLAQQAEDQALRQADSEAQLAQHTHTLLEKIQASIEGLHEHPALRYEPLKRLAVHLAEQLVLTELTIDPTGTQRLIERCLETLDVPASSQVVVDLNPDDLALLQSRLGQEMPSSWRLQAHVDLLPGSVRVTADDAVVSDLVEHRLSAMATTLLLEPQRWQAQSLFEPQRLQARSQAAAVQDAMPKPTFGAVGIPGIRPGTLDTEGITATGSIEEPMASAEDLEASDRSEPPPESTGEDHAD
jgi:flagellar biosynthesis/type III secretory pathway protein FliH